MSKADADLYEPLHVQIRRPMSKRIDAARQKMSEQMGTRISKAQHVRHLLHTALELAEREK